MKGFRLDLFSNAPVVKQFSVGSCWREISGEGQEEGKGNVFSGDIFIRPYACADKQKKAVGVYGIAGTISLYLAGEIAPPPSPPKLS